MALVPPTAKFLERLLYHRKNDLDLVSTLEVLVTTLEVMYYNKQERLG